MPGEGDEAQRSFDAIQQHSIFVGVTESGSVLLHGIRRWERASTYGGHSVDVCRFWTDHLIVGLDIDEVVEDQVQETALNYAGLASWAGQSPVVEEVGVSGDEFAWRASVRPVDAVSTVLHGGLSLSMRRGWTLQGGFDVRTLATPLRVEVGSGSRESASVFLGVLDAVHALLSLAHTHDVRAGHGSVRLTATSEESALWDSTMMTPGDSDGPGRAYFGLEHIGGIEGVGRWVELCQTHRRAVAPLVSHRLFDNQTPESRLLATCAAMEYWVAAHRRTQEWAKKRPEEQITHAIAATLDPSFGPWVGGGSDWASRAWARYQELKHDPAAVLDAYEVHYLELAGRWALTALLLDHCADGPTPSRHLFSRSLWQVGAGIRRGLEEQ
jgi:hypothetical protein